MFVSALASDSSDKAVNLKLELAAGGEKLRGCPFLILLI